MEKKTYRDSLPEDKKELIERVCGDGEYEKESNRWKWMRVLYVLIGALVASFILLKIQKDYNTSNAGFMGVLYFTAFFCSLAAFTPHPGDEDGKVTGEFIALIFFLSAPLIAAVAYSTQDTFNF